MMTDMQFKPVLNKITLTLTLHINNNLLNLSAKFENNLTNHL